MQFRELGTTGLTVSALGYGARDDESLLALERAIELGRHRGIGTNGLQSGTSDHSQ